MSVITDYKHPWNGMLDVYADMLAFELEAAGDHEGASRERQIAIDIRAENEYFAQFKNADDRQRYIAGRSRKLDLSIAKTTS